MTKNWCNSQESQKDFNFILTNKKNQGHPTIIPILFEDRSFYNTFPEINEFISSIPNIISQSILDQEQFKKEFILKLKKQYDIKPFFPMSSSSCKEDREFWIDSFGAVLETNNEKLFDALLEKQPQNLTFENFLPYLIFDDKDKEKVTIDKFNKFIALYGPVSKLLHNIVSFESLGCFVGLISREVAETKLKSRNQNCYLVKYSQGNPGELVLFVCNSNSVNTHQFTCINHKFTIHGLTNIQHDSIFQLLTSDLKIRLDHTSGIKMILESNYNKKTVDFYTQQPTSEISKIGICVKDAITKDWNRFMETDVELTSQHLKFLNNYGSLVVILITEISDMQYDIKGKHDCIEITIPINVAGRFMLKNPFLRFEFPNMDIKNKWISILSRTNNPVNPDGITQLQKKTLAVVEAIKQNQDIYQTSL